MAKSDQVFHTTQVGDFSPPPGKRSVRAHTSWWQILLGPKGVPYFFIAPFFILFLGFWVFPATWSLILSFQHWSATKTVWVGTSNYLYVLGLPAVRQAFANVIWYVIVNNVFQIVIALALALFLDIRSMRRWSGIFRIAFFMPNIVSGVTVAILFSIILGTNGVMDHILSTVNIHISWLQSPEWSKPAVILAGGWRWIGYWVVMLMAGLQGIPDEYYEAAILDGVTFWQRVRYITLPLLRPVLLFVIIINTMGTMNIFEEPLLLFSSSSGGPLNSATTPVLELYKLGFLNFDLGSAAALGWLLSILIIAVSVAQFALAQRRDWIE
ncbi:carbohydrate ABC transporter permease [Dictyobacter formicarum]|nr:sugar ABC transporter permease [Dictyobacter formicarum]